MRVWILFIVFPLLLNAQEREDPRLFLYAGGGLNYYVGDLKDNMLPQGQYLKPFWTVGMSYQFKNILSLGVGFLKGDLVGADRFGNRNSRRNFEFKSFIRDYHILAKLNLFNFRGEHAFTPGLLIGAGFFQFEPHIYAAGEWHLAQPMGTEGQYLGGNNPAPYKLQSGNLKFGIEFTYKLSCRWYLDVYTFYNKTFTDYLDDVSGVYPDYDQLLQSENGEQVVQYTYTYDNGFIPPAGADRGKSEFKDGYWNMGVNLNYQFLGKCLGGKKDAKGVLKKKKKSCATYI